MSFSAIGADPSWGTVLTADLGYPYGTPNYTISVEGNVMTQVDLGPVLQCAAIDRSGLNLPANGWQMSFSGGGGPGPGPTRPTAGMLYPRGDC